ncbi:MAG TPA: PIN domain-containing protein [Thermoanaerobaculia bacterium]
MTLQISISTPTKSLATCEIHPRAGISAGDPTIPAGYQRRLPGHPSFPEPWCASQALDHEGEVGIATAVWHELLFGWERLPQSRKKKTIGDYLFQIVRETMPILPYDQAAAEWHARERARLTAIGKTPPFLDGQIAATAKVNGLILVTANGRTSRFSKTFPLKTGESRGRSSIHRTRF